MLEYQSQSYFRYCFCVVGGKNGYYKKGVDIEKIVKEASKLPFVKIDREELKKQGIGNSFRKHIIYNSKKLKKNTNVRQSL